MAFNGPPQPLVPRRGGGGIPAVGCDPERGRVQHLAWHTFRTAEKWDEVGRPWVGSQVVVLGSSRSLHCVSRSIPSPLRGSSHRPCGQVARSRGRIRSCSRPLGQVGYLGFVAHAAHLAIELVVPRSLKGMRCVEFTSKQQSLASTSKYAVSRPWYRGDYGLASGLTHRKR